MAPVEDRFPGKIAFETLDGRIACGTGVIDFAFFSADGGLITEGVDVDLGVILLVLAGFAGVGLLFSTSGVILLLLLLVDLETSEGTSEALVSFVLLRPF